MTMNGHNSPRVAWDESAMKSEAEKMAPPGGAIDDERLRSMQQWVRWRTVVNNAAADNLVHSKDGVWDFALPRGISRRTRDTIDHERELRRRQVTGLAEQPYYMFGIPRVSLQGAHDARASVETPEQLSQRTTPDSCQRSFITTVMITREDCPPEVTAKPKKGGILKNGHKKMYAQEGSVPEDGLRSDGYLVPSRQPAHLYTPDQHPHACPAHGYRLPVPTRFQDSYETQAADRISSTETARPAINYGVGHGYRPRNADVCLHEYAEPIHAGMPANGYGQQDVITVLNDAEPLDADDARRNTSELETRDSYWDDYDSQSETVVVNGHVPKQNNRIQNGHSGAIADATVTSHEPRDPHAVTNGTSPSYRELEWPNTTHSRGDCDDEMSGPLEINTIVIGHEMPTTGEASADECAANGGHGRRAEFEERAQTIEISSESGDNGYSTENGYDSQTTDVIGGAARASRRDMGTQTTDRSRAKSLDARATSAGLLRSMSPENERPLSAIIRNRGRAMSADRTPVVHLAGTRGRSVSPRRFRTVALERSEHDGAESVVYDVPKPRRSVPALQRWPSMGSKKVVKPVETVHQPNAHHTATKKKKKKGFLSALTQSHKKKKKPS
ncbi:PREDICTED: uncharacterized protein LOC106814676 [Priapulus caudatus]|uniref:Uncharacterized protein LOC106814676 n=1 Tax=Priapulus caudatus TaxID=37621 RepID=A0ABM1EQN6_PRICU|nr:PREDICTED: uncharacterized protein LOC106814676 [Priapulus caudatus]